MNLNSFLYHHFTHPVYYYEKEKKILKFAEKFIKEAFIPKNSFIPLKNIENVENPIFYIVSGKFEIYYKKELITVINTNKKPVLTGETNYIRAISSQGNYPKLGEIFAKTNLELFLIDINNFNSFDIDIQEIIVENMIIELFDKILNSNKTLERILRIKELIEDFLSFDSKIKTLNELISKIRRISTSLIEIQKSYLMTQEEEINIFEKLNNKNNLKKFDILKNHIIPKISSLKLLPENFIYIIAKNSKWLKIKENETIVKEGEKYDGNFYILISGSVNILSANKIIHEVEGPTLIVETNLYKFHKGTVPIRLATVKAKTDIMCIKMNMKYFTSFNKKYKIYFFNSLIFELVERLRNINELIYQNNKKINSFLEKLKILPEYDDKDVEKLRKTIYSRH